MIQLQLKICLRKTKEIFFRKFSNRVSWITTEGPRYLYAQPLDSPNKKCFICQTHPIHCIINVSLFTFQQFIQNVLTKNLGFQNPDIVVEHPKGNKYFEAILENNEEYMEVDDEDQRKQKQILYQKKLNDDSICIDNNATLTIKDNAQDLDCEMRIHDLNLDENEYPQGFVIATSYDSAKYKIKNVDVDDNKNENNTGYNNIQDQNDNDNDNNSNNNNNNENRINNIQNDNNKIIGKKRKLNEGDEEDQNEEITWNPKKEK